MIPTAFNLGTLPGNHMVTVRNGDNSTKESNSRIKIVLPFLKSTSVVGDGFFDVNVDRNLLAVGASYVLFGTNSSDAELMLSDVVSRGVGFKTPAVLSYDHSGRSVSNVGDINGDTFDDLIIGVPYAARCYVMFGTKQGFVNMTEGFTIFGAQSSDLSGWSVSGAGDVNNDTYADIIIGAPFAGGVGGGAGAAYVVFGKQFGFTDIYLDSPETSQVWSIAGVTAGDCFGMSVDAAGLCAIFIVS